MPWGLRKKVQRVVLKRGAAFHASGARKRSQESILFSRTLVSISTFPKRRTCASYIYVRNRARK